MAKELETITGKIIAMLSDGEFYSGEMLGKELHMTRAGVWKQLKKLSALGVAIESVKGKGYRILGGMQLLSSEHINEILPSTVKSLIEPVKVFSQIDSTNAELLRQFKAGANRPVCFAEQQNAGRGRRGRQWVSPYGHNIYASFGWTFDGGAAVLEGLSLVIGIAVAQTLEDVGIANAALKWPNDVLINNKKIAGILLEMSGDAAGVCHIVVGIGINVRMTDEQTKTIDQPWTSIERELNTEEKSFSFERNVFAANLIAQVVNVLKDYDTKKFHSYQKAWHQLNAFTNKNVELHLPREIVQGKFIGVNERGAVILNVGDRVETFYGGEISLRSVM